jgi:CDP-diacylglycerol--glycerol-3-phosphate 3-phosphatidyltransferase
MPRASRRAERSISELAGAGERELPLPAVAEGDRSLAAVAEGERSVAAVAEGERSVAAVAMLDLSLTAAAGEGALPIVPAAATGEPAAVSAVAIRPRFMHARSWNLPNTLTVARLLMVPAIALSFDAPFAGHELVAPGLFVLASITDSLDGRLARRSGRVTELGKFLDPLADKLLILTVLAVLLQDHLIAAWMAVVILARELLITGLRAVALPQGLVIAATPWGKTKTVSQMLAVGLVMLQRPYPSIAAVAQAVLWLAVAFTIFSGLDYLWRYRRLLQ